MDIEVKYRLTRKEFSEAYLQLLRVRFNKPWRWIVHALFCIFTVPLLLLFVLPHSYFERASLTPLYSIPIILIVSYWLFAKRALLGLKLYKFEKSPENGRDVHWILTPEQLTQETPGAGSRKFTWENVAAYKTAKGFLLVRGSLFCWLPYHGFLVPDKIEAFWQMLSTKGLN